MAPGDPSWQELTAFVDGSLPPGERARVARAIAERPALARQVEVLRELRAAAGDDGPGDGAQGAPARPARRTARRAVVAAVVLLLLVAGAAGVWLQRSLSGDASWLARAWQVHAELAAAVPQPTPPRRIAASLGEVGPGALVPDLSSASLSIGAMRLLSRPDGAPALAVQYRGNRGCKLTLLMAADVANSGKGRLKRLSQPPRSAFSWHAEQVSYLLLAEGMAEPRLQLIAQSVHWATVEHASFDRQTRTVLQRSRRTSPPCQMA